MTVISSTPDLALKKLASSGLQDFTLGQLHMEVYTSDQTAAVSPGFHALPSLVINYMEPRSPGGAGQPLRHHPMYPPFKRYRYLVDPPANRDGKIQRYVQPPNQGVCAYFPPLIDWNVVLDERLPVIITEGELKAAKATSMGFPTIGLGGVSNISSRKTGRDFLPELEKIEWAQRIVYICFDNDGQPKPDVLMAINKLAGELEQRGAICYLIRLPAPANGKKMGLDDFFLEYTRDDFIALIETAESMTLAQRLWEFNDLWVKVEFPNSVLNRKTGEFRKLADWIVHHNNLKVPEQVLQKDGSMSLKKVGLAQRWVEWEMRMSVSSITYAPGQERYLEDQTVYNTWEGWGAPSIKGDVSLFKELLTILFGTHAEGKAAMKWFLQWLAYPIQHPGAKLYTSVLMWGSQEGTGKTLVGYVVGHVYGKGNWSEVKQHNLHGNFNGWAARKQFVIGDDITGSDKHEIADKMKSLITQENILINEKFVPEYSLPNVANFYLTSNRAAAVYMSDDDRRYFVWEVQGKGTPEFYAKFDKWYKTPEAIAAVRYFLDHIDLEGFNPYGKAMNTSAKEAMQEAGKGPVARWCSRLRESPEAVLRVGNVAIEGDLFSSEELLNIFRSSPLSAGSTAAVSHFGVELKAASIPQLQQVKWGSLGKRDRFFAVRNPEKWINATPAQIRKHVEATKR